MKKLFYLVMATLLVTSCQKDPNYSDLDREFLVYTSYDTAFAFNAANSFYIPDSILMVTDDTTATYWKDQDAQEILTAFTTNMVQQGYIQSPTIEMADLGIQVSYVEDIAYFVNPNANNSYWWWDYPGYWDPGYWGDWIAWYYPYYPVRYAYTVGSFFVELVDLNAAQGAGAELPVVWNIFLSGLLTDNLEFNMAQALKSIDQAFVQSPYVKAQ